MVYSDLFFYDFLDSSITPQKLDVMSMPTAKKWDVSQHQTMVPTLSKDCNYLAGYHSITDDFYSRHAQLLEEVRQVFGEVKEDSLESLIMVDILQRLGIDYHYQEEIEVILKNQYNIFSARSDQCHDLFEAALRFRLLRQQGFNVPADMYFNIFKDKEGKFEPKLGEDVKGLIGLYEASNLCIEGEDILDDARDFSGQHLNAMVPHLEHHQARMVTNTLRHPYHKNLARFMVKDFLDINFQGRNESLHSFVELAKIDFNLVQSIHQKEILQVSKWWNDLGLAKELKFARDQPLKWYCWSMACLTNPCLSEQRIELTKPISLIYIIDDIFDVFGTLDELTLFTEAINRWEFAATEKLPDSMKICFKALYDITNEIAYKVYRDYGWNPIHSLQRAWAQLCNSFLVEAIWFASGHLPTAEEYLKNAVVSSGVPVVLVHMMFLLGQAMDKESVDVVDNMPGIISSTATILRLWDDLGSAKDENQEGHDGSYLECYMKEHPGSSVQATREHVLGMVSDSWKRLNQECLTTNPFSASFIKGCLNAARMVPLMYSYDDNHDLPSLKDCMMSLLFENISL